MNRPCLYIGDLVKLNKNRKSRNGREVKSRVNSQEDPDKMYRVINIAFPPGHARRLNLKLSSIDSSESWAYIHVVDEKRIRRVFLRRELWRIPNQPRNRNQQAAAYVTSSSVLDIFLGKSKTSISSEETSRYLKHTKERSGSNKGSLLDQGIDIAGRKIQEGAQIEIKVGMKFKHSVSKGYVGTINEIQGFENKIVSLSWTLNGRADSTNYIKLSKVKRCFKKGDWILIPETTKSRSEAFVTKNEQEHDRSLLSRPQQLQTSEFMSAVRRNMYGP